MKRQPAYNRKALSFISFVIVFIFVSKALFAADGINMTYNYIKDSNDRIFHDKAIRIDYRQLYAVGYLGDWQRGGELGGYLLDSRRSSYDGYIRIREFDKTYHLGTEQVLREGYVAQFQIRYIHIDEPEKPDDRTDLFVYGLGFVKYYGDYNYFSAIYYNDPRKAGRFSVILSNTLATQNSSLRLGVVPRSDGTLGYFVVGKYRWFYMGYSYTREFDFATFDREVVTVGFQIPFDLAWNREQ